MLTAYYGYVFPQGVLPTGWRMMSTNMVTVTADHYGKAAGMQRNKLTRLAKGQINKWHINLPLWPKSKYGIYNCARLLIKSLMEASCARGLNFVRPLFSVKILPEMTIQHSDSCAHLQMNDHQDMWSCKSTYSLSLISLCQSLSIYWPFYYTNKQSIFLLHAKRLSRFKFSLLHITEFFRDVPLEKTTRLSELS